MSSSRGSTGGKAPSRGGPSGTTSIATDPKEQPKMDPYAYIANANLVLPQNRREAPRRDKETGSEEVESLYGKIDPVQMGARVFREKPTELLRNLPKSAASSQKDAAVSRSFASRKLDLKSLLSGSLFSGLTYKPRSQASFAIYELLLGFVHGKFLPEVPEDVLRSAVDDILSILKNENRKDLDKKRDIEQLLDIPEMAQDDFGQLIGISKRIADYHSTDEQQQDGAADTPSNLRESNAGMTILFEDDEDAADEGMAMEEPGAEDGNSGSDDDADVAPTVVPIEEAFSVRPGVDSRDRYWLDIRDLDAFWIQRQLSVYYQESEESLALATSVFDLLKETLEKERSGELQLEDAHRFLENHLGLLLDFDKFDLIKSLIVNRRKVVYGTLLSQVKSDVSATADLKRTMEHDEEGRELLQWLETPIGQEPVLERTSILRPVASADETHSRHLETGESLPALSLEGLGFSAGSHTMTNKKVELPTGSWKQSHPGYEMIGIPAPAVPAFRHGERLVSVGELPEWAQPAFSGMKSLNRIQSALKATAFDADENMLVCAPTGAGKTNVALLAMLQLLGAEGLAFNEPLDLSTFKLVYIAPMKALVQEMVETFTKRLAPYHLRVAELSGDVSLNKQALEATQVIVTTPEKWDVITRKHYGDLWSFTRHVKLVIFDEIHLLHDERGPVLEALVARFLRHPGPNGLMPRLVGLSATLPNYLDVAAFLRVHPKSGLFHFDTSFRPCPLSQTYLGITERKAMKKVALLNSLTYDKTLESLQKQDQMLIFVHSRKETFKTGKYLRDTAISKETVHRFLLSAAGNATLRSLLEDTAKQVTSRELAELLPYGIGMHHAGLSRSDRSVVEELFAAGHLSTLVSTATLAWGVNLPAHTVLIKGTQVYSPEKGAWTELSPQDILQMFGRAGRPQFDSEGHGILLTSATELQYYLSLCNMQLPIESQLLSSAGKLPELLNAEIVLGHIATLADAVDWFSYTYLYVRMMRAPALYPLPDEPMPVRCKALLSAALVLLDRHGLVQYDQRTATIQPTELGRIGSYYYLSHATLHAFHSALSPHTSLMDLLRIFASAHEFSAMPVRSEEKAELARLLELVPLPVKETADDPLAKVNVLLQTYLSGLSCTGFALMTDLVYISASAGRLFRALLELALLKGWPALVKRALELCVSLERKTWSVSHPLRQLRAMTVMASSASGASLLPDKPYAVSSFLRGDLLKRLDKKDIPLDRLLLLEPSELGELYKLQDVASANLCHRLLHDLPRPQVHASMQPVSPTEATVTVTVSLAQEGFTWDPFLLGSRLGYLLMVEDHSEKNLLYHDHLLLTPAHPTLLRTFTIPLQQPLSPLLFLRVFSESFLHCDASIPISFKAFLEPKLSATTDLLDLTPLPLASALDDLVGAKSSYPGKLKEAWEAVYHTEWSPVTDPIETQLWRSLLVPLPTNSHKATNTDSALITSHTSLDRLVLLSVLGLLKEGNNQRVLVCGSGQDHLAKLYSLFKAVLGADKTLQLSPNASDVSLSLASLQAYGEHKLAFLSAATLEQLSRKKAFYSGPPIKLVLLDIHSMNSAHESCLMRFMSRSGVKPWRVFGRPITSGQDMAAWLSLDVSYQFTAASSLLSPTSKKTLKVESVPFRSPIEAEYASFAKVIPAAHEALSAMATDSTDARLYVCFSGREALQDFVTEFAGTLLDESDEVVSDAELLRRRGVLICSSKDALDSVSAYRVVLIAKSVWNSWQVPRSCHRLIVTSPFTASGLAAAAPVLDALASLLDWTYVATRSVTLFCPGGSLYHRLAKGLSQPSLLPLESSLPLFYGDYLLGTMPLNAEAPLTPQSLVEDLASCSFYYYRLLSNPNYYGMRLGPQDMLDADAASSSEQDQLKQRMMLALSETLSEVVEATLEGLSRQQMVDVDEASETMPVDHHVQDAGADTEMQLGDTEAPIAPEESTTFSLTDSGWMAAYYGVARDTLRVFQLSMKPATKVKGLLELVCTVLAPHVTAFLDLLPDERVALSLLYEKHLPHRSTQLGPDALLLFIVLQAFLEHELVKRPSGEAVSLVIVSGWLRQHVLPGVFSLLAALMEVAASQGYLTPSLAAIDVYQGLIRSSILLASVLSEQLPTAQVVPLTASLKKKPWLPFLPMPILACLPALKSFDSIYDVLEVSPSKLLEQVGLATTQSALSGQLAELYSTFPASLSVDLPQASLDEDQETFRLNLPRGATVPLKVTLKRPMNDRIFRVEPAADTAQYVYQGAPLPSYLSSPVERDQWWLILAHPTTKTLLSIKKIPVLSHWAPSTADAAAETMLLEASLTLSLDLEEDSPLLQGAGSGDQLDLTLYLITDAWSGADQEFPLQLHVTN